MDWETECAFRTQVRVEEPPSQSRLATSAIRHPVVTSVYTAFTFYPPNEQNPSG